MSTALYGHAMCRCGKGHRAVADWELESEREYWERGLAEVGPESDAAAFIGLYLEEVNGELERRKRLSYGRARKPFDLEPIIEAVKDRADIVALFDHHLERKRTITSLGRAVVKYRCFLHEENTPSLCVWPTENRWWCFGCHNGGDVIAAAMKLDNIPFVPAVLALAGECGVNVPERPRRIGIARLGSG